MTRVVECVGVLSKHPHLTIFEEGGEVAGGGVEELPGESAAERSAHFPPPSLVPRLHCILVRTLAHCNPLLPRDLPRPLPGEGTCILCVIVVSGFQSYLLPSLSLFLYIVYLSQFGGVARSRDLLLSLLTPALLGDGLAAEYTLLHLLSSVYGRTDMMALGKLSLNLTRCSSSSPHLTSSLHTLLTKLLPQVCVCLQACVAPIKCSHLPRAESAAAPQSGSHEQLEVLSA